MLVYLAAVTIMYRVATPEMAGPALTEREERNFRVAALRLKPAPQEAKFVGYTLSSIRSGKVDPSAISFLLPNEPFEIAQGDIHSVSVLERHAEWQLVEYRFANTYDSVSRYRAFKDRIEPLSYRITMHPGVFIWAFLLLIPAWLVGALVNLVWPRLSREEKS